MTTMTRRTLLGSGAVAAVGLSGAASAARVGTSAATSNGSLPGRSSRLVVDGLDVSTLNEAFLDLARQGGVDCIHKSVGLQDATIGSVYEFVDRHSDRVTIATTVRAIRAAKQEGKIAYVLGWQDSDTFDGVLKETREYPSMVEQLRSYAQLGVRIIGICYNHANIFGAGCMEHRSPLTAAGRRLVEELHKHRIVLDVGGHTGEQTTLDAIAVSGGVPVVCTHTNVASINNNMRCISDRVAEAIAGTGGVIGVTAVSDFHNRSPATARTHGDQSPQVSLDKHLDQYDYLKKLVGVDHIGLGPDFVWGNDLDGPGGNIKPDISVDWPYEQCSVGRGWAVYIRNYENISMLPNVVAGLKSRGWSEPELDKVLGANWLRVYERVWGA